MGRIFRRCLGMTIEDRVILNVAKNLDWVQCGKTHQKVGNEFIRSEKWSVIHMEIKEIKAALECILFISGNPVALKDMQTVFEVDKITLKKIINQMIDEYERDDRGLRIIEANETYQFATKPKFYTYIERLFRPKARSGLSQASLETLSIIAYKQPVTRAYVDSIRGVNSDGCMYRLLDKELIHELGRMDAPGRPILYGTTDNFLRLFGLKTIMDLPDITIIEE